MNIKNNNTEMSKGQIKNPNISFDQIIYNELKLFIVFSKERQQYAPEEKYFDLFSSCV